VWRWWFENRNTGEITIAQFPNWPLAGIGFAAIVRRLADDGTTVDSAAGWVITSLWLYWGADEVVRGVNPWRRLLGVLVIAWQGWSLVT